jgi:hypothetical protein
MGEGPDVPKQDKDEIVLRILRRAADEREAARDELRLADECDGPLEPFWRRAAETHERSAEVHERTARRLATAAPPVAPPPAAPFPASVAAAASQLLSLPRPMLRSHQERRAVAHEGAAAAHENAAKLHENFALAWDERHREAMAARERLLAEAQRALAAASRRRADHERASPLA